MKAQSMDLLEFQKLFPDDAACMEHLHRLRWADGFICPRCGNRTSSYIKTRRLRQCKACRYQASLTAGTVFHRTRTPIHKWFWMIFMMTRQKSGVAMLRMQALLSIGSYKTAWLMGHKIRKGMEDRDSRLKLAGLVDLRGALVGREMEERRQRSELPDSGVELGAVTRGEQTSRGAMRPIEKVEGHGGAWSAKSNASSGGSSDLCGAVASDGHADAGGRYPSVVDSDSKKRLKRRNWLYAAIANVKGNIRGVHHGVSQKHLHRYLAEFLYRFNRRLWDAQLFTKALVACIQGSILTFDELTT